jgi:ribosomal protein L11 methylase PrmA
MEFVFCTPKVPYVPSSEDSVRTMVELSGVSPKQKVADLGSGDGRILIAFAKAGAEAHGYEIDANLVLQAENNILKEGVHEKAFVHPGNYWDENLSRYEIIAIYGMTSIMARLQEKLHNELKPGSKIVSNVFTFPHWQPVGKKNSINLYIV